MPLPGLGTLVYNGYPFSDNPFIKSSVTAKPLPTDSKLSTKLVEYEVNVSGTIQDNGGTDVELEDLRARLSEWGAPFHMEHTGFGLLRVNDGGNRYDFAGGPRPQFVQWLPLGGGNAANFVWKCVVTVPDCLHALAGSHNLLMRESECSWSVQNGGLTTRRTNVTVEVPQAVLGGGRLLNSADEWYERVLPARLPNFRRKIERRLGKAKNTLVIDCEDEELPSPLPDHVDVMDLDYTVRSGLNKGFAIWQATLSGEVQMIATRSPVLAFDRFMIYFDSRIRNVDTGGAQAVQPTRSPWQRAAGQDANRARTHLVTDFQAKEKVNGRSSWFSVTFTIFKSSLTRILQHSGMWREPRGAPMPGFPQGVNRNNGQIWVNTMPGPRGRAGLAHDKNQEVVIDVCHPERTSRVAGDREVAQRAPGQAFSTQGQRTPPEDDAAILRGATIPPEQSWLDYFCETLADFEWTVARHRPIGTTAPPDPPQFIVDGPARASARVVVPDDPPPAANAPDVLQSIGAAPACRIWLRGYAFRFKYPIPIPEVLTVGGVTAVRKSLTYRKASVGAIGGTPVNFIAWSVGYEVAEPPDTVPVISNPVLGTDGHR